MKEIVDKMGRRYMHHRPSQAAKARLAIEAARYARAEKVTRDVAAAKFGVSVDTISRGDTVLTHGTPEEIASLEAELVSLRDVYDVVLKRTPRDVLKQGRKPMIRGDEAKDQTRVESQVWSKLTDALDNIVAMPAPADVVRIVKKNGVRTSQVDKRLMGAFSWITEFADAWTK
jgi:hypothetical protein